MIPAAASIISVEVQAEENPGAVFTPQTGRTMKFYSDQEEAIRTLTPEMIDAALKKHWDFSRLVIVIAGDLEKEAE